MTTMIYDIYIYSYSEHVSFGSYPDAARFFFDILFCAGLTVSLQKPSIILLYGIAGLLHQLEWAASRTALSCSQFVHHPSIFPNLCSVSLAPPCTLVVKLVLVETRNHSFLHCSCVLKIGFESEVFLVVGIFWSTRSLQ